MQPGYGHPAEGQEVPHGINGAGRDGNTYDALMQARRENDALRRQLQELEALLKDLSRESGAIPGLKAELQTVNEAVGQSRDENRRLRSSLRTVEEELYLEKKKREAAEAECAQFNAEKQRLEASKGQLTAQLRLANERVREAEEEQCKAEADTTAARRELHNLQTSQPSSSWLDDPGTSHQELQNEKARAEALSSALADSQANLQALRGELRKAHESMKELQMRQLDGRSTPAHSEDVRLSQGSFTEPTTPGSELQDGSSSRGANDPELQQLRKQVSKLTQRAIAHKNSRDKLLFEVDRQSVEVETLLAEITAVKGDLSDTRKLTGYWQKQSKSSLNQIDKLKDMLEESGQWSAAISANQKPDDHQVQLEAEKSQSAKLDAEVRRLQSELIESASNNLKLKRSWLPVLHGIEAKLMQAAASAQDAAN